ncbi:hypothetical protein [Neomegalonema sp.]|uniref:hypothetical protein n=1 Tax=Neomegalonema sp. TaxID=2039713 RepID=UPI00262BD9C7|nr:hypothetical protein [Neomegalonema sp.]MDD2869648.1 hypothetical protein [Neomegalonema sp.]
MQPKYELPKRRYTKPSMPLPVDRIEPVKIEPDKISWIDKLWMKFDNWKRNTGLLMAGAGYIVTIFHPAGWGFVIIGGFISGIGLIHDLYKKQGKDVNWNEIFSKENIIEILKKLFEFIVKLLKRK